MSRVAKFYDAYGEREWTRLERHRMEYAVTMRALARVLPPPPARVLDIGGGPGRYSVPLAAQGYTVTLVDLSPVQLNRARMYAEASGVTLEAIIEADALDLPATITGEFDVTLLLGPLYHLLTSDDRARAIDAALCRMRPGGILAAAFITRFAPFRDAAIKDPLWIVRDPSYVERVLQTGIHDQGDDLAHAYFAHPAEVVPCMEAAGLTTVALLGVEGIVAGHEAAINALTGEAWEAWVTLNERLAHDPALLGAADHVLYIGRKPADRVAGHVHHV